MGGCAQTEDDITASVVVPAGSLKGLNHHQKLPSLKFSQNVEFRLFQRPDEAIHKGFDKITEQDMSRPGCFISNFEPLNRDQVPRPSPRLGLAQPRFLASSLAFLASSLGRGR